MVVKFKLVKVIYPTKIEYSNRSIDVKTRQSKGEIGTAFFNILGFGISLPEKALRQRY